MDELRRPARRTLLHGTGTRARRSGPGESSDAPQLRHPSGHRHRPRRRQSGRTTSSGRRRRGVSPSPANPIRPDGSDGLLQGRWRDASSARARDSVCSKPRPMTRVQRREVREITAADATDRVDRASGQRQGGRTAVHVQRRTSQSPGATLVFLNISWSSTPGCVQIAGRGQGIHAAEGSFQGIEVPLGDLLTDRDGRLIVLGGFGTSQVGPAAAVGELRRTTTAGVTTCRTVRYGPRFS